MRDRIALILNLYPATRNSDIELQLKYWTLFQPEMCQGGFVSLDAYPKLARLTSITRERARLQNTYKLFQAKPDVAAQRERLAEDESERAVEEQPTRSGYVVYMDESGKTSSTVLVGSLWLLEPSELLYINQDLNRAIAEMGYGGEFHFAEMTRNDLPAYKRFAKAFFDSAKSYSLKCITIPRSGIRNIEDAVAELYYHLLVKGVEQEHQTGRAPLPRRLSVWKDAEVQASDKLKLAGLEDKLKQAAASIFGGQLQIGELTPVNSKQNWLLQVTDLYVSSVSRVHNKVGTSHNHKDAFAEFFYELAHLNERQGSNSQIGDMSVHISL